MQHTVSFAIRSISIHALREEGDTLRNSAISPVTHFYPRPPRGGRLSGPVRFWGISIFLSTPSARRATCINVVSVIILLFLSTPSARRATGRLQRSHRDHQISIHALREEGDDLPRLVQQPAGEFLSTPSARRATGNTVDRATNQNDFYPRPPRGGRRRCIQLAPEDLQISIHALREEGDVPGGTWEPLGDDFYPRPPRGGRRTS